MHRLMIGVILQYSGCKHITHMQTHTQRLFNTQTQTYTQTNTHTHTHTHIHTHMHTHSHAHTHTHTHRSGLECN